MKFLAFLALGALILPTFTYANVKPEFEWSLESNRPDRSLRVCFHRSLDSEWQGWVQEAVDKWNAETDDTGWRFEVVPFVKDSCQVFILLSDISESENAGARFDPLDVMAGQDEQPDGYVNGVVLTLDSNLEETKKWMGIDEDISDTTRDGWSIVDGEGTRDPIDVVMHELGHAMRLDHHDDYDAQNPDGDISDPKQPGEHYHDLSDADIRQAKDANIEGFDIAKGTIATMGEEALQLGRATLDIPKYAFGYWYYDYEISLLEAKDFIPVPLNVPNGYSHVFDAVGFFTSSPLQDAISMTLPYQESDLEAGKTPLDTAEGFFPPGLQESTIAVVRFEKNVWDLTPIEVNENPSTWSIVPDAVVDTEKNTVTFTVDEAGYYGLVATADNQQPPKVEGYTRVLHGDVLNEDQLNKALFFSDLRDNLLKQLPAFIIGFLAGALIVVIWTRRGRKAQ